MRRYDAWYRHIALAMLAHHLSVTAAIAHKTWQRPQPARPHREIRRLLARLIHTSWAAPAPGSGHTGDDNINAATATTDAASAYRDELRLEY